MKRQGQIVDGPTPYFGSQLGAIRDRVSAAGLRHGDKARIRVRNVRAAYIPGIGRQVFFCESDVDLLEIIEKGDGQQIQQNKVEVPKMCRVPEGAFDLEGTITSNGRLIFDNIRLASSPQRQTPLPHGADTI